jgi:hypothetical protein
MGTVIKRRTLFALLATAIVCLLFLAWLAGDRREVSLDGTYESGPEQSKFFPDGDCSKKPFWFNGSTELDYDWNARVKALGYPTALRVKLIGRVSRLGKYGHLGGYPREVWPIKIISVDPASPCGQGTPKPDFYDEVSQTLIGQQITIRGKFSLRGKITVASVWLDNHDAIYLEHKGEWGPPYSEWEGKRVAVSGILRFYQSPPAKPTASTVARLPDHFYFEEKNTRLRLIP